MDEQTPAETPEREETIEDLELPDEQADDIKGGKVLDKTVPVQK